MYVTVKMPREKMAELREIKAKLMLCGNINVTDSDVLSKVLDVAGRHESEFIEVDSEAQWQELSKFFGAWSYMKSSEVKKMKSDVKKWRKNLARSFA